MDGVAAAVAPEESAVPPPERANANANSSRAQELYQIGLTRLAHGDLREAYEDLKEATRLEPNSMVIWQKYEEAYSAVQPQLAEEHLVAQAAAARGAASLGASALPHSAASTSPASASPASGASVPERPRSRRQAGAPQNELPPTFTFVAQVPSEAPFREEPEAEEMSQAIVARMFRGQMLRDDVAAAEQQRQMAELGFVEAAPARSSPSGSADQCGLAFNMQNPRIFIATILSWVFTWLLVTVDCQILRKKEEGKDISWVTVVVWCLVILACAAASWRCATHLRVVVFSFSDGIKMACGIVIVVAVAWHKLVQEASEQEAANKLLHERAPQQSEVLPLQLLKH